jgi:hypothetical protein
MDRRALFLTLFLIVPFSPLPIAFGFRSVQIGTAMPPAGVKDLEGRSVDLTFKARASLIFFWRAGQEFSLDGLQNLEEIKRDFAGKGVEILAIAEGGTTTAAAQAVVKRLGLSYRVYIDAEHKFEEKVGVIVFPSTGIVAPGGRLKFYLPSRNSNYGQIIRSRLSVELGLTDEKEFDRKMKQIGEELGGERAKAQDHFKAGIRLSREGNAGNALIELKQALALDPDLTDARLAIGFAYLDLQEARRAQTEFEAVLKQHPASPGARLGLGIAAARLGELDKGIEMMKEAIQINPDPVQGYYELGRAYEKKGDLKQAMHSYKWAVRKLLQGRR